MKIRAIIICATLILTGVYVRASAQQKPSMRAIITWRTQTLVPSDFSGKVLPGANSPITASVEVVQDGKLLDTSSQTIYWYLNDDYKGGGRGQKTISVQAPSFAGDPLSLRVEIPDLAGSVVSTIEIPMASPLVVIDAPYPRLSISTPSIQVRALPYYFSAPSASRLSYEWQVQGIAPKNIENPQTLSVSLPSLVPGFSFDIYLSAKNPYNEEDVAQSSITFSVPR